MPSKKIGILFIVAVLVVGGLLMFSSGSSITDNDGFLSFVSDDVTVVEDIDRILSSNVNRTDTSFEEIANSALLVTLGKLSADEAQDIFPDEDSVIDFVFSITDDFKYQNKDYTLKDLKTVRNSEENYQKYIIEVVEASVAFAETMTSDELAILSNAVENRNESSLLELDEIINKYKAFQNTLLGIAVIKDLSAEYLEIINNYSDIILAVGDMRKYFYDPVSTLVGIEAYREKVARNDELFFEIGNYIINYQ